MYFCRYFFPFASWPSIFISSGFFFSFSSPTSTSAPFFSFLSLQARQQRTIFSVKNTMYNGILRVSQINNIINELQRSNIEQKKRNACHMVVIATAMSGRMASSTSGCGKLVMTIKKATPTF